MHRVGLFLGTVAAAVAAGCGPEAGAFSLRFAAVANGHKLTCTEGASGFGPNGDVSIGASDLRFYVSNLELRGADGAVIEHTLDENDFQLARESGKVALIDLTNNTDGTCGDGGVAFAEGTGRTNDVVAGTTAVERVTAVSFDVGVPQALMKDIIGSGSVEAAPSPLNEMFWTWASGYRHVVFNFAVTTEAGGHGDGYVHVGSRDCGPGDGLALEDRAACDFVNTPRVAIDAFSLTDDVVEVDVGRLLRDVDFVAPIYDPATFEIIGEGPGVECHSSPDQPHCAPLFSALGVDIASGVADAADGAVFAKGAAE